MNFGLKTGGPAVFLWGWVVVSFFTMINGLVLAEICSTYPLSGSVYQWAGLMAKKRHSAFASYLTGWLNFIFSISSMVAIAFGVSRILVQYLNF